MFILIGKYDDIELYCYALWPIIAEKKRAIENAWLFKFMIDKNFAINI